jgi:hypothetical protein
MVPPETDDYVRQVIEELYDNRENTRIDGTKAFKWMVKSLKSRMRHVYTTNKTKLENMYLIFVIPDEWTMESTDIIQEVFIPLLLKVGVIFPGEYRDRVLFIGELQASMAFQQLSMNYSTINVAAFMRSENRCIQYTLCSDRGAFKFKTIYFQVKEDYESKVFNRSFYTINIISKTQIPLFSDQEFDNVRSVLKQFIFKNLLKLDCELTINKTPTFTDTVLDHTISAFYVRLVYPTDKKKANVII